MNARPVKIGDCLVSLRQLGDPDAYQHEVAKIGETTTYDRRGRFLNFSDFKNWRHKDGAEILPPVNAPTEQSVVVTKGREDTTIADLWAVIKENQKDNDECRQLLAEERRQNGNLRAEMSKMRREMGAVTFGDLQGQLVVVCTERDDRDAELRVAKARIKQLEDENRRLRWSRG